MLLLLLPALEKVKGDKGFKVLTAHASRISIGHAKPTRLRPALWLMQKHSGALHLDSGDHPAGNPATTTEER